MTGEKLLRAISELAVQAGKLFEESEKVKQIEVKEGHANFVTLIDKQVQALLEARLPALVPGSRMIGEEDAERSPLTDEPTWIVDPVDGTTNLIHDYRHSVVSIALLQNRRPVLGLIYCPYTQEMFTAVRGEGAYLNGRPIHVSDQPFERALIGVETSPYNPELADRNLILMGRYHLACADIRVLGSAALALAYLAAGRTDAFCALRLLPWDVAAGAVLIEEAGGIFDMPLTGEGPVYDRPAAVLAGSPTCFEAAKQLFLEA